MAYGGLETIYQNEGPAGGAITSGQREALSQVSDVMDQRKKLQDYDRAEQMNPLDVQYKQQEIQKLQNENQLTQGTMSGKIDATNAENLSKITKSQMERVSNLGHMAGQIGTILSSVPEGLPRQQAALQWMQENNIHPQSQAGQYILNNSPEKLFGISQKMSQLSDAWINANMQKELGLEQERIKQRGATEREQMGINAGKYKKSGALSWSQKFETLDANKQLMTIAGALQSGKSPITGEPMDEDEKQYFMTRYQQAKNIVDAQNAAKAQAANQGIAPTVGTQGNVELAPRAPLPSAGVPMPGQTPQQPARGTRENPIKLD